MPQQAQHHQDELDEIYSKVREWYDDEITGMTDSEKVDYIVQCTTCSTALAKDLLIVANGNVNWILEAREKSYNPRSWKDQIRSIMFNDMKSRIDWLMKNQGSVYA